MEMIFSVTYFQWTYVDAQLFVYMFTLYFKKVFA